LKIGFVYDVVFPFHIGGHERRNYELGRRLARDHEVHIIGWQYWPGPSRMVQDGVQFIGVGKPVPLYDAHGRRTLGEAARFATAIVPHLLREDYDVIDCTSIPYLSVLAARSARLRSNILVTWPEFMGDRWKSYLGRRAIVAALLEQACARVGKLRLPISDFTSRRLPGEFPPKIVLPNGIDTSEIESSEAGRDGPDLLFVGRLLPHKRAGMILDAMRLMGGSVSLGLVGTGSEEGPLRRLAERHGMADRVRFYGSLADSRSVYGLMKSSRVFVQPSEQEGQSIVVMEAMACGLPPVVVDTEFSAAKELLSDGNEGFVVPASPDALASALARLLEDHGLREEMAANARQTAESFDWSRPARRFADVCQDAMSA
jgi:glycosyltransferase involved in cell wall biosynthesis